MNKEHITFAGGCFWCTQGLYDPQDGVLDVVSGFAGGTTPSPTYDQVASGKTDYREAAQVTYDPSIISAKELIKLFFGHIDPTDEGGQFADRGHHYTTAIYYHNNKQQEAAQEVREELDNSSLYDKPIVTEILPYSTFYPAESYHQHFHKKHPLHYKRYVKHSGRQDFIKNHSL